MRDTNGQGTVKSLNEEEQIESCKGMEMNPLHEQ